MRTMGSLKKTIEMASRYKQNRTHLKIVHGIGSELAPNWEQNMLYTKSW